MRLQLDVDPPVNLYPIEWKHLLLFRTFKDLEALSFAAMLSVVAVLAMWHSLPAFNGHMAILAIGVHFAIIAVVTNLSGKGQSLMVLARSVSHSPKTAPHHLKHKIRR